MNSTMTLCKMWSPAFFTFYNQNNNKNGEKSGRPGLTECRRYIHLSLAAPKIRDKELPKLRTVLNSSNLDFLCTLKLDCYLHYAKNVTHSISNNSIISIDWIYIHVETCAKIWQLRRTHRPIRLFGIGWNYFWSSIHTSFQWTSITIFIVHLS